MQKEVSNGKNSCNSVLQGLKVFPVIQHWIAFKNLSLLWVTSLSALYMMLFLEGVCKVLYRCWRDNGAMQLFTYPGSLLLASRLHSTVCDCRQLSCTGTLDPSPWSTWHLLHLSPAWHSLQLNTLHCTASPWSVCKEVVEQEQRQATEPLSPPSTRFCPDVATILCYKLLMSLIGASEQGVSQTLLNSKSIRISFFLSI